MKAVERQLLAALDRLHRELSDSQPCRWQYDGSKDNYSCSHLSVTGREVISRVELMNHYPNRQEGDGE